MDRNSPLREIKGVGAKTEELFHKIGVYTVGDILLHYPRTYIQYPQAKHVDEYSTGNRRRSWTDHKNTGSAEGAHHADHSYDDQ